jgi:methionine-gamma-lyase
MSEGFGTTCIRQFPPDKRINPHMEGLYPTTTYSYESSEELIEIFSGKKEGYIYSRWGNPGFEMAEKKIAALESWSLVDGDGNLLELKAQLFASGMGAISALFISTLKAGEKIIAQGTLYGGTSELMQKILAPLGIETIITELKDLSRVEEIIRNDSKIKMIYIETPANPTIDCYDIENLSAIAKKYNCLSACDNTFATPYLQQPFRFGVDFVLHSTTKYLNGHGNAMGGILLGRDITFMKKNVNTTMKMLGNNSNPFDAWLLLQGIKTLELRMDRHCSNAMQVAQFLEKNNGVSKVNYCGLSSHPDYQLAKKQMKQAGGMLSFELKGGIEAGKKFLNKLKTCSLAVSLGTVDTIVQHPATMSHLPVPKETREKFGITDGLIRLSVGIENVQDIIEDLDQAISN